MEVVEAIRLKRAVREFDPRPAALRAPPPRGPRPAPRPANTPRPRPPPPPPGVPRRDASAHCPLLRLPGRPVPAHRPTPGRRPPTVRPRRTQRALDETHLMEDIPCATPDPSSWP